MTERVVEIRSDAGIHARPAMMLVKEAMKYPCEIFLVKDDVEANGKSIMSVLSLAITKGSNLVIRAVGKDENEAVISIATLIESDFNAG
ncbi:MAG TPA: HPr family phosphocarrier protein [Spirochaetota bacterium]|jgi:phosphocarrier protein|nr:HPr family phosphocarrier protein [Spirochaetota bacterium]HQO01340.1 HPr family phosphocarrier protein [Spirochaetota bacterium]HQP49512.1 HPr family phosphocarrier protein [Spirochaetota bacterium]